MNSEFPRLPLDEDNGRFHPANMAVAAVNGIVALEAWRQRPPKPTWSSKLLEKVVAWDESQRPWDIQRDEIDNLKLSAIVDPEEYKPQLYEKLETYHSARAEAVGSYVVAVEAEKPRFSGIKKWFAGKKQAYHQSRAMKAAEKLLSVS